MKKLLLLCVIMSSCGVDEMSDTKIVGGQNAPQKKFYGRLEAGGRFMCGSSLIEKRWVITARHCIKDGARYKVRLGAVSMNSNNDGKPFDLVDVQKIYKHPKYDLALLELGRPARFNPIKYGNGKNIPAMANVRAFGFGQTSFDGGIPKRLQTIRLKYIRLPNGKPHMIYVGAGVGKDICFGDSGGPLLHAGRLVGVTSWTASRCGTRDTMKFPSGYVRVDLNWLQKIIR